MQFFPPCGLSCLHLYPEWNIQPLWKVKGLEQYTLWKVRFFREVYTHIHIHIHVHIHFQKKHVPKHVRVRGWVVGCVVRWCGVVWCVDVLVSFSLVFSNLKLVISKGFFRRTSEARDNATWEILVSRKFAIRDEPNVRLRCSRYFHLFYR